MQHKMVDVAARIAAHFGKIEILINNAGINTRSDRVPIHQYTLADWHRILEIDLTGVFATSRAVIPYILEASQQIWLRQRERDVLSTSVLLLD